LNAYSLTGVTHGYGGDPVVRVPELVIPSGSFTALVGPNGAGKSTLLHLLALLAVPDAGRLEIFGQPVTRAGIGRLRREVSLFLQHPYLFRTSVARNVAWGLDGLGLDRRGKAERVDQALEWVGLSALAQRPARTLSGGEGQRLALARLLARRPRIILLDEPTAHVDDATTVQIEQVLSGWVREHDTTVVLATHDAVQAERLGATRLRMAGGKVGFGSKQGESGA